MLLVCDLSFNLLIHNAISKSLGLGFILFLNFNLVPLTFFGGGYYFLTCFPFILLYYFHCLFLFTC